MDQKKRKKEQMDDAIETATKKAEIEELQSELAKIRVEHEEINNQLKRAIADYRNLETRVQQGRSELTAWGTIDLITKLLMVLDYLEQALIGVTEGEKQSGWLKGVEMAVKQFKDVLKSEGLEEIKAEGEFNPALHEAVDTAEGEDNHILKIVRKGYNLQGKVLRPAQVIVGRKMEEK